MSVVAFYLEILLIKVSLWKGKGAKPSVFTNRSLLITKLIQEGKQQRYVYRRQTFRTQNGNPVSQTLVRYGPLLRLQLFAQSDFGSTSISLCTTSVVQAKRLRCRRIDLQAKRPVGETTGYRSWRPLANWSSRLQYKVITCIRITLLQFQFTMLLFRHIFPLVIALFGVNAFFFLKCYFCEKLGCKLLLSSSPKPLSRVYCIFTVV